MSMIRSRALSGTWCTKPIRSWGAASTARTRRSAAARLAAPRALLGVMIAEWLATGFGLGNLLNGGLPEVGALHPEVLVREVEGERVTADVIVPRGEGPHPVLVYLHGVAGPAARLRIERYVRELSHIESAVTGDDLIALGLEPSAAFSDILRRSLDDRLDEVAVGREAEMENLRRLARGAGAAD